MTDYDKKQVFCKDCGGMKELYIDGESVAEDHWIDYGFACDIGCVCNNPNLKENENMENRKTVKLGNGDILYIDGICEDDENFYTCSFVSKRTGNEISKIRVPVRACIESDKGGINFECVPANKRQEKEAEKYKELVSLNFEADYSNVDVWVHVKKIGVVKVYKTTKKSVHFIDEDGKKRYTAAKNIKGIYNYSPDKELPTKESQKKQKVKKAAASKGKKIASAAPAVKTDNYEYIQEVPREADYKGRHVFIDIDENKKGLKVKKSHGGRIFWVNTETGKYSAISLKRVNSNENIVVYEYK